MPEKKERNDEILRKYTERKYTVRDLAKIYGLHFTTVNKIILNRQRKEAKMAAKMQ